MVLFVDLSDVLIQGMYGMDNILRYRFGKHLAEQANARHEELYDNVLQDLFRGKITEDEYWARFMEGHYWPDGITAKVFKTAFGDNMKKPIPGTLEVFNRIYAYQNDSGSGELIKGRPPMVLVSDHIRERIPELMKQYPDVFKLFDLAFWSCNLGMVKADKGFFEHVLDELDLDPREAILIDDSGRNIASACRAGIENAIHFQHATQLETELMCHGITFEPELVDNPEPHFAMAT